YKAQGIRAVFIHPRPGLVTEYLSERWFSLVRYTVERAREHGMLVWLYDENSYPSGFAGGHVPAEMPESWKDGQGLTMKKIAPREAAGASCSLLLERRGDGFVEVAAQQAAAGGELYCFERAWYPKSIWYGGHSYVDLLKPGVTEKFIELTMRGYERTIGSEFGKTVPGIFTDEPHINPPARGAMRWTPDLFEQFQKRWGYDLKTNLVSLFQPVGDWRKIRHNYHALLLELFIERWAKPWFRYTESRKLLWTGHYWEHEWPHPRQGPDNMAMYAWHHVPGIDMLFNQFSEDVNAQFGNVRSVKELASVANQLGRSRALSETYGGAGWELRFEEMKRLGDWQAALGVNLVNQHLSWMTIAGARKYDYPPTFSYHSPWWSHYRILADYFGRLSLALASGEQINRILVLEPTTSAWMYAGANPEPRMKELGEAFQQFITRLEKMQGEYDLGSENIIRDHGRVAKGRFVVGRRAYELVVLPPGTENLDSSTVKLLERFLHAGGSVLSFVEPPARVDGASSDRLARLAAQHVRRWQRATSLDDPAVRARLLPADIRLAEGELFHHRRILSDGQILFFANASMDEPARAQLDLAAPAVLRLDLVTGKIEPHPAKRDGSRLAVSFELPPAGSLLLYAGKATGGQATIESPGAQQVVAPVSPLEIRRLAPNAIRLDYCDLLLAGKEHRGVYFHRAADMIYKHFGFPEGNPWDHAIQYRRTFLDRGPFPPDSGFEAAFHFELAPGVPRQGLALVVERPQLWQVSVNGQRVSPRPGEWFLDRSFGVFDIAALATEGRNTVRLLARPFSVHHELEPVCVLGEFGVEPQARGFRLVPPRPLALGSWKSQHLPFYSGWVSYAKSYRIPRVAGRYKVRLGRWHGTLAEVRVNGRPAGFIAWQPYETEITAALQEGENRIEVLVCGSHKNLFGPHHGKIRPGISDPWSFRNAPDQQPPGAAYHQLDYGLMEDWQLVEMRP
ncbi:MAG: glycosyl hydrolase, partial [Bryobacterales bacterium]|nr:glycosyl hydrolase [Bryobacteraceae bacterium]MDW8131492.1 glycosyl hydrolase [Bryobacterales bacterium]